MCRHGNWEKNPIAKKRHCGWFNLYAKSCSNSFDSIQSKKSSELDTKEKKEEKNKNENTIHVYFW